MPKSGRPSKAELQLRRVEDLAYHPVDKDVGDTRITALPDQTAKVYEGKAKIAAAPVWSRAFHGRVEVVLACSECNEPFVKNRGLLVARPNVTLSAHQTSLNRKITTAAKKHECSVVEAPHRHTMEGPPALSGESAGPRRRPSKPSKPRRRTSARFSAAST